MKRTHLNSLVDAAAFVAFLFLTSTGMVLLNQLPPGSGGRQGFGTGHGALERPVQLLWGWTRHEWGQIHYWTAYAMMAILALHLLLHWRWIVGIVRGKPSVASPYRLGLGCVGFISVIILTAIPMASSTTTISRGELQEHQLSDQAGEPDESSGGSGVNRDAGRDDERDNGSSSIRGSMTLEEIARASGTPVTEILDKLGLPKDVDPNEQAGRVLRQHGLQMSDLRAALKQPSK